MHSVALKPAQPTSLAPSSPPSRPSPEAYSAMVEIERHRRGMIDMDESEVEAAERLVSDGLEVASRSVRPAGASAVVAMLGRLAPMFPAARQSAEEARLWANGMVEILQDLPNDLLQTAARTSVLHCRFLPTVAELVEIVRDELSERERLLNRFAAALGEPLRAPLLPDVPAPARRSHTAAVATAN